MSGLIDSALRDPIDAVRFYGVAVAEVVSNDDSTGLGRVQLRLPWLPGFQPWARVVVLSAGSTRGTYFIPQTGDEVLVAFNHGDVREPFVVGSLWNGRDRPPRSSTRDPIDTRVIRTPAGHEIELDDAKHSITISSATGQKLTMDQDRIEASAGSGAAKLTLTTSGDVTIEGATIHLKASGTVEVKGASLDLNGSASAKLEGGGSCTVRGGVVQIN